MGTYSIGDYYTVNAVLVCACVYAVCCERQYAMLLRSACNHIFIVGVKLKMGFHNTRQFVAIAMFGLFVLYRSEWQTVYFTAFTVVLLFILFCLFSSLYNILCVSQSLYEKFHIRTQFSNK